MRRGVPEIELQLAARGRAAFKRLVRAVLIGEIAGRLDCCVINRCKDLAVDFRSFRRIEGHLEAEKDVCESLHADSNRPVPEVASFGFRQRVEIDVNDAVEVARQDLDAGVERSIIVDRAGAGADDECRKTHGSQVADGDFVGGRELADFLREAKGVCERREYMQKMSLDVPRINSTT